MLQRARYIVIEGPIGVGKTTLARRLASHLGGKLLLEAPGENPFLARFYENPRAWAFSAQLSFLLQRAGQMSALAQSDLFHRAWVADFMLEKDRLFAELTLAPEELELYQRVHERVIDQAPRPDVVVYLQAPVPVLRERIARRGIGYEQQMDAEYLQRIVDAYVRYFHDSGERAASRVVLVDAADVDFVGRDDHFAEFVDHLEALAPGQHRLDLTGRRGLVPP